MSTNQELLKSLEGILEKRIGRVLVKIQQTLDTVSTPRVRHLGNERQAWTDFANKVTTPSLYSRIKDPINGRFPR